MLISLMYLAKAMAHHPHGGPIVTISGIIAVLYLLRFLGIGRRGMF